MAISDELQDLWRARVKKMACEHVDEEWPKIMEGFNTNLGNWMENHPDTPVSKFKFNFTVRVSNQIDTDKDIQVATSLTFSTSHKSEFEAEKVSV